MPRIVIAGAGAAGIFTAYRLRERHGPACDIVLIDAFDRIGGNARSTTREFGARPYSIDAGAQFFSSRPQSSYVQLIGDLGLAPQIDARATGLTIWDRQAGRRRLWVPSHVGGFLRYGADDWRRLIAFATLLVYAFFLDRESQDNWNVSVDDWLDGLALVDAQFKDEIVRPLLYQFVTLPADRIGEASARYALTYLVRNAFGEPGGADPGVSIDDAPGVPTFEVLQSRIGLDGVLQRALDVSGVTPRLGEAVVAVGKNADGTLRVTTSREVIQADHVVLATDPPSAAGILAAGSFPVADVIAALQQCEYSDLRIALQEGQSCWMPDDSRIWEAVNTVVDGSALQFSVWFGPLRDTFDGNRAIPVFKSWATPNLDPASCPDTFFSHAHRILMPTTTFMARRREVLAHQGRDRVWFAGGWTNWFDSQEAALDSATDVAGRIADPSRGLPALAPVASGIVDRDHERARLERWLSRAAAHAPLDRQSHLRDLIREVETRG